MLRANATYHDGWLQMRTMIPILLISGMRTTALIRAFEIMEYLHRREYIEIMGKVPTRDPKAQSNQV